MQQSPFIASLEHASTLDVWILCLKVMATGISSSLLLFVSVFAWSRRGQRDRESVLAARFAFANFFAALYIASDTAVRLDVFLEDFSHTLFYYRLALSAVILSVAAYAGLYMALDNRFRGARHLAPAVFATTLAAAGLVWVDDPRLIIANNALHVRGASVFADYGAAAPWFFALGIALFAGICIGLFRAAREPGRRLGLRINLAGFGLLLAAGIHDTLRELGIYVLPFSTLSLGYTAFQMGAFGYVALHYSRTLRDRRHQHSRLQDLKNRVTHDARTGVYNRTFLEELLDQRAASDGGGLLFIDLDDFKSVNDRFGHLVGDVLLRRVAKTLCDNLRAGDFPCRWGGDEFVVYLVDTDADKVRALAERLRSDVEAIRIDGAPDLRARVSLGFAPIAGTGWRDSLARADQALYESKHAGKDRLTLAAL